MTVQWSEPRLDTLEVADFTADETLLVAAKWRTIFKKQVDFGEMRDFGFQVDGRIYAKLQKAGPANLLGKLRLEVRNPAEDEVRFSAEFSILQLNNGATDRRHRTRLPPLNLTVGAKAWMVVMFKCTASETLDASISTLAIDTTRWVRLRDR